jgi:amino acid transporter
MSTEPRRRADQQPPEDGDSAAEAASPEPHLHSEHHPQRLLHPKRMSRNLTQIENRAARLPGNKHVRVVRPFAREFKRTGPGHFIATEEAGQPKTGLGALFANIRRLLIGRPIASEHESEERVNKFLALALFSSDALSSVAYATEQILFVLAAAGMAALSYSIPISFAIVGLLFIVIFSYRQTIFAYPQGGGSYQVASDNLGTVPGLIAGASLLVDYILTVAVSVSAGVANITSVPAIQWLHPYATELSIAAVLLIMLGNLRGLRESGTIFAAPTYLFVFGLFVVIGTGVVRYLTGGLSPVENANPPQAVETLSVFLILSAFANGCTALTGVEAISNSVPAFRKPEPKNAATTLLMMGGVLGVLFLGTSFLAHWLGISWQANETVISQITRAIFGESWFYLIVLGSTMLILILAANTSFTGFPRLASILARDKFLPHQFSFRGDRLAYSVGIIVLAIASCLIIGAFHAEVELLIPLYAVGVFTAFTLSQSGMVLRWWRRREQGWQRNLFINGLGAIVTAVVALIFGFTKFQHGAWVVIILIPGLVGLFLLIRRHYRSVADQLTLSTYDEPLPDLPEPAVLVPVAKLDRATLRSLAFARSMSEDVTAVHVTDNTEEAEQMRERWERWTGEIPLVILESPYRALLPPLTAYIDAMIKQDPARPITVVLSEFVPRHWWEYLLHNQTALRLKFRLFFMPNTVVVDVPYHLGGAVGLEGSAVRK